MNNQPDNERRNAPRRDWKLMLKLYGLSFLGGLGGTPIVNHPDERIAATTRQWVAFSGNFLSIALGIDLVVRFFILRQSPTQYVDIALIYVVNVLFVGIGLARNGASGTVNAAGKWSWKTSILMVVIISLEVPALLALVGMIHSPREYANSVLQALIGSAVMIAIMHAIYRLWERRTFGRGSDQ